MGNRMWSRRWGGAAEIHDKHYPHAKLAYPPTGPRRTCADEKETP